MRSSYSCGVAVWALLAVTMTSAPAANITVSPSAAGLSDAANFSFEGIRTSDFSSIDLTSVGSGNFSFKDVGFLPIATFDPGNFTPPGLNGSPAATPYGLYLAFSGSGLLATVAGDLQGSFNRLTYAVMGDPGFSSSFNHFDASHQVFCAGCSGDVTLATGTLLPSGTNSLGILQASTANPLPSAFVDLTFDGVSSKFFASPSVPFRIALDTQFSNTSDVIAQYTTGLPPGVDQVVTIGTPGNVGGAGSGQFVAVSEPKSMGLLGASLVCLGLIRRRFQG